MNFNQSQGTKGALSALIGAAIAVYPMDGHALLKLNTEADAAFQVQAGQQKKQRKHSPVTLNVTNTSIESVLRAIGEKSNLRIAYDAGSPELQRKISINIKDANAFEAVQSALRGSALEVTVMSDSSGMMISKKSADTLSNQRRGRGIIQGSVVDSATRQPVAGATITIPELNVSVTSDKNGTFKIAEVSPGKHYGTVRFLGYSSTNFIVTVSEGKPANVQISIQTAARALSGVVTTAIGERRRVEVAHDIVRIDAEKIAQRSPVRTFTDLIEAAQVQGVTLQRQSGEPGAPTQIRIRGIGSISQTNDPVIIIDGVWIDSRVQSPSRLDDLDPATIQTVEIVRGPSAATLYGQDASNGVIIITTKRGRIGEARWNLSYNRDMGKTYGRIPLAYVGIGHDPLFGGTTYCTIANIINFNCIQDSVKVMDPNSKLLDREGSESVDRYTFGVNGGNASTQYSIVATTNRTTGVRRSAPIDLIRMNQIGYDIDPKQNRPSKLERYNLASNFTMNPSQDMTIGLSLNTTQTKLTNNSLSYWFYTLSGSMLEGELSDDTITYRRDVVRPNSIQSPVRTESGVIGGSLNWRPWQGAVVLGNLGYERNSLDESRFERKTNCHPDLPCADTLGFRSETYNTTSVQTMRLSGSSLVNIGKLSRIVEFKPAIGGDFRKIVRRTSLTHGNVPPGERTFGFSIYSTNGQVTNATAGWYLNATIGIINRLYFDVGVRQDIGSAITSSSNTKYPKLSTSWLVSDESIWPVNNIVNSLRLRTALGHAAVQPDVADIKGRFIAGYSYIDGLFVRNVEQRGIANRRIRPERATEIEFGFDADMFYDRVTAVVTYAHSENVNTLVERELPPSVSGEFGALRKENIARIRNRNFELSADARVIDNSNILTILSYGMTLSDNVVKKLGNNMFPFSSAIVSQVKVGYPLAGVWVKEVLGYKDLDKNNLIGKNEVVFGDSLVYVGWSQPRYRANYGASVSLFNLLTLDTRLSYQSRYVQQYTKDNRYGSEDASSPLQQQALEVVQDITGRRPVSDLRWNSASITYHVPKLVVDRLKARSLAVSLQASNLALWTNYSGRDPSVKSLMTTELLTDNGNMIPVPRRFVLDFKLGF